METLFLKSLRNQIIKIWFFAPMIMVTFQPLFASEAQDMVKIHAYLVSGPMGMKHEYYSLTILEKHLPVKVTFNAGKKRGILYLQEKDTYSKLYFYLGYHKYKFNEMVLTTSWPVLYKDGNLFFPLNILKPVLRQLYSAKTSFHHNFLTINKPVPLNPKGPDLSTWKEAEINDKDYYRDNQSLENQSLQKEDQDTSLDYQESSHTNKNPANKDLKFGLFTLKSLKNIIIDPGHGGRDPGAIFREKGRITEEKSITLAVSRLLAEELRKKNPGQNVTLTRKNDKFLDLEERTQYANNLYFRKGGSLFISLHVNSSLSPRTRGIEIFYLAPNKGNELWRISEIVEKNLIHGPKRKKNRTLMAETFLYLSQIQEESKTLASTIQKILRNQISPSIRIRTLKQADFMVLRGSLMPAILIEMGFMTNNLERKKLTDRKYQEKIARAIAQGIQQFIREYNKGTDYF